MANACTKFTAEQRATIVRRHLKGKELIATIAATLSEVFGEERDRKLQAERQQRQEKGTAVKQVA
jgi:hypothetical protein